MVSGCSTDIQTGFPFAPVSGELSVRRTGILHNRPAIEERWNPRHASMAVAAALRRSVVENLVRFAREAAGLH